MGVHILPSTLSVEFLFHTFCESVLSLMFIFLHIIFFLKFSSDYWGGKKGVLPPHPNYLGGACPGCPPRVYAYATATNQYELPINLLSCWKRAKTNRTP